MNFILVFIGIIIVCLFCGFLVYFHLFAPLRKKEPGYDFVFVEDNGTVRELSHTEIEYLERPFMTDHPARPAIKRSYGEKNENGGLSGFIKRRRVPEHIKIENTNFNSLPKN